MADPTRKHADNVAGAFFVDQTCIDCDTCRQLAPRVFAAGDGHAFVHRQPADDSDRREALRALLSCPTGSIGTVGKNDAKGALADFPLLVESPVFYCGFTSAKSFGGSSYFIKDERGNWLVDSPKFLPHLVKRIEQLGGIRYLFLTHRDDVADAARYAERFGCRRIIHREEIDSQPGAEIVLDATEPVEISRNYLVIPTPGHTAGHCCLLVDGRFLFTGDHLWWNRRRQTLDASKSYCWYSWPLQIRSMRRLLDHDFEWVLPGHGQRVQLPARHMNDHLRRLVERMENQDGE